MHINCILFIRFLLLPSNVTKQRYLFDTIYYNLIFLYDKSAAYYCLKYRRNIIPGFPFYIEPRIQSRVLSFLWWIVGINKRIKSLLYLSHKKWETCKILTTKLTIFMVIYINANHQHLLMRLRKWMWSNINKK